MAGYPLRDSEALAEAVTLFLECEGGMSDSSDPSGGLFGNDYRAWLDEWERRLSNLRKTMRSYQP
jgi:hypothetical protein